jgi:hypothetical protein
MLVGPGEMPKLWPVQTSILAVLSQGTKHGRVGTLSGVQVKIVEQLGTVSLDYYFHKNIFIENNKCNN